ncbi:MAG TPA: hypothetical protein VIK77_02745 [Tissierellaceae bacterium]
MKRTIGIYSSKLNKMEFLENMEATTFDEFKNELSRKYPEIAASLTESGVMFKNMAVTEESSSHSFESGNAVLPEGEFTFFVTPKNPKSGGLDELKDLCDDLGIDTDGEESEEQLKVLLCKHILTDDTTLTNKTQQQLLDEASAIIAELQRRRCEGRVACGGRLLTLGQAKERLEELGM